MSAAEVKKPGFPNYPPHHPAKRFMLGPEEMRAARKLRPQRWSPEIRQATWNSIAGSPEDPNIVRARLSVVRYLTAQKTNDILTLLSDPRFLELTARIESRARILLKRILVGRDYINQIESLVHLHAISDVAYKNLLAGKLDLSEELKVVLSLLTYGELGNDNLLMALRDDPVRREEIVRQRADYDPIVATDVLFGEMVGDLKAIKLLAAGHDPRAISCFPRSMGLSEDVRAALGAELDTAYEAIGFFNHDSGHAFVCRLFLDGGPALDVGENAKYFLLHLADLKSHLKHFENVFRLARWRLLGGELPSQPAEPIAGSVETAVIAAAYRHNLTVNRSGLPKESCINLYMPAKPVNCSFPAALEIQLYNIIKNAAAAGEERKSSLKIVVTVENHPQYPNVLIIKVQDNASGFNIKELLKAAKKAAKDPRNKELIATMPVFKKIELWEENENVYRTFTAGELLDLAFVARISGYSETKYHSGLGLKEVSELCLRFGQDVLLTDNYSGGATVTMIIGPEREERNRVMELAMYPSEAQAA